MSEKKVEYAASICRGISVDAVESAPAAMCLITSQLRPRSLSVAKGALRASNT